MLAYIRLLPAARHTRDFRHYAIAPLRCCRHMPCSAAHTAFVARYVLAHAAIYAIADAMPLRHALIERHVY